MNEQNLVPFDKMPKEEHLALSSLGGVNSGKARQGYKAFREKAQDILTEELQEELIQSMIAEAKNGNVRAYQIVMETAEGKMNQTIKTYAFYCSAKYNVSHLPSLSVRSYKKEASNITTGSSSF